MIINLNTHSIRNIKRTKKKETLFQHSVNCTSHTVQFVQCSHHSEHAAVLYDKYMREIAKTLRKKEILIEKKDQRRIVFMMLTENSMCQCLMCFVQNL